MVLVVKDPCEAPATVVKGANAGALASGTYNAGDTQVVLGAFDVATVTLTSNSIDASTCPMTYAMTFADAAFSDVAIFEAGTRVLTIHYVSNDKVGLANILITP